MQLVGLADHRRHLSRKRTLRFREIRGTAQIIRERLAQIAIAARGIVWPSTSPGNPLTFLIRMPRVSRRSLPALRVPDGRVAIGHTT